MNKNSILKICVVIFFASYLIIGLFAYDDYGISTDEVVQRHHGLVSAKYVTEFFSKELSEVLFPGIPDIHEYEFKIYGVIFHLPLILLEKTINFEDTRNLWLFRHLCTFLFFYVGTIFFYLLAKQRFNSTLLGLLSVIILIISPRIFSDSFYNIKDAIFLSAFTISLYFMIQSIEKNKLFYIVIFSISAAFATNIRIIAIILPVLYPFFILMKKDISNIVNEKKDYLIKLYLFGLLYLLFVFTFWPASWSNPLALFLVSAAISANFPSSGEILYMGNFIKGMDVPWHYIPVWILITTPAFYSIFFVLGLSYIMRTFSKSLFEKRSLYTIIENKLWQDLIFLIIIILPILLAIIFNSTLYNGWRHFYFIYPPIIIFIVLGLSSSYNYLSKHKIKACNYLSYLIVIAIFFQILTTSKWMQQNHPHQNIYFSFAVNLFGDRDGFDRDYWRLSTKQALEWLLKNKNDELDVIVYHPIYDSELDKYDVFHPINRSLILKEDERIRLKFYYKLKYYSRNTYLIDIYRYPISTCFTLSEMHTKVIDNIPIFTIYRVDK